MEPIFVINLLFVGGSFAVYVFIPRSGHVPATSQGILCWQVGGVHPVTKRHGKPRRLTGCLLLLSSPCRSDFRSAYVNFSCLMGWTGACLLLQCCSRLICAKFGKYTVPDSVGDRFNSNAARRRRRVILFAG